MRIMADFEQDIYEYLVKDSDAGQRIDKLLSIQLTDFPDPIFRNYYPTGPS